MLGELATCCGWGRLGKCPRRSTEGLKDGYYNSLGEKDGLVVGRRFPIGGSLESFEKKDNNVLKAQ